MSLDDRIRTAVERTPLRPGDLFELAIWLNGEEMPGHVERWRQDCEIAAKVAEVEHSVEIGPFTWEIKRPGEDRVPPVPEHIQGIDVRLLVGQAQVRKAKPIVLKETGFVADLDKGALTKLRAITRRAHARAHPGDRLEDKHCDWIIERMGPEVALKTLREDGKLH